MDELILDVNIAPASVDAVGEHYDSDTVLDWLGSDSGAKRPVYLFHGYAAPRVKQENPLPAGEVVNMLGWQCRESDDPTTCGHYATVRLTDETPQGKRLIEEYRQGKKLYGSLGRWNPLSKVDSNGKIRSAKLVELSLQTAEMGLPPANFHARVYSSAAELKAAGLDDCATMLGESPMLPAPLIQAQWLLGLLSQMQFPMTALDRAVELTIDPATGLYTAEALKTLETQMREGFDLYSKYTREKVMSDANAGFQAQVKDLTDLVGKLNGDITSMSLEMATLKAYKLGTEAEAWASTRFLDPKTRTEMVTRYVTFAQQDEAAQNNAAALKSAPPPSTLEMFTSAFPEIQMPAPTPAAASGNSATLGGGGTSVTRQQNGQYEILKVHIPDWKPATVETDGVKTGLDLMMNPKK